jgi:hypothetical protein
MESKEEMLWKNKGPLPNPSAFDLMGRQSVRVTFKLSTGAIEALSIVATHLGIKQKSIFDHLIEDARSLTRIAKEVDGVSLENLDRVQKTFVISRNTLLSLEKAAKRFNTPRDALIELSIRRLLPIIFQEQQRHEVRKNILYEIDMFFDEGLKLLSKLETDLGDEDPMTSHFKHAIRALSSAQNDIRDLVARGEMIENFDFKHLAVNIAQGDRDMENDSNKLS